MTPSDPPSERTATVAIVDYDFGNVRSVANALEAVGAEVRVSRERAELQAADALILPGVGAFGKGMANLQRFGLVDLLAELVLEAQKPFLGICVGMQLLAQTGYENGEHRGLGWIDADVARLEVEQTYRLKVPHVGWNDVTPQRAGTILGETAEPRSYYFVHSYYLRCREPEIVLGTCEYGLEFPAAIQKDNIWAVQFHPEKSQKHGLNLLRNFIAHAAKARERTAC